MIFLSKPLSIDLKYLYTYSNIYIIIHEYWVSYEYVLAWYKQRQPDSLYSSTIYLLCVNNVQLEECNLTELFQHFGISAFL